MNITQLNDHTVSVAHIYSREARTFEADWVIMVTMGSPNDKLYTELMSRSAEWKDSGIQSVTAIGDCVAPGPIAQAVHDGHRYARDFARDDGRLNNTLTEPVTLLL
ncbi:MAG: hypothetical protein AAF986_01340 [Pseudomonadota bacterium]